MKELTQNGTSFEAASAAPDIWVVRAGLVPLCVAGVNAPLCGRKFFWFLLCKGFLDGKLSTHLRIMRALIPHLGARHATLHTLVQQGWPQGARFARYFGFRPTGETVTIASHAYDLMELRA